MTYSEWGKLSEAERIERCAKALGWKRHEERAIEVWCLDGQATALVRDWNPLRSRDDCQALIEAVAALRDSAKQMRFGQSIIRLYTLVDPDLLAWAACEALEGK